MSKTPEEEATSLGWQPEDEWKGAKDAWKPAEQFLEDGERMAGFVRKRLEKELNESKTDFEARISRMERTTRSALETQQAQATKERDELLAQLNVKKKAAIADNDLETLEIVREQIADVKEAKSEEPDPADVKAATDFRAKHEFWQGKNFKLQNFADGAAGRLQGRNLSPQEFFSELDKQIRETFPEEFGKPKRGGGLESDSPSTEASDDKTYKDLPKEARQACDDFIKRGLFKNKQDYVNDYFGAETNA